MLLPLECCYIWHNVTIEDGCELKNAIVCDGVILKAGAVLEPGVVLSFKLVIGEKFVVPSYSKVSLLRQPINQDSDDEELNHTDGSSIEEGNVILEINSLRLAYNMTPLDCAAALFYSLMKLAFHTKQNSTGELQCYGQVA